MAQKKQTDDEIYRTLLENYDAVKHLPNKESDNIEPDDDDDEIFKDMYPD